MDETKELAISVTVRCVGGLLLLFDLALVAGNLNAIYGHSLRWALQTPLHEYLERAAVTHFVIVTIGIGLLLLRKWAALAFSILLLYPAYWSFVTGPGPFAHFVGFVWGIIFVLPSIFTLKYWHVLVWRKKKVVAAQ